ncbi:MAG: hypothetical protein R3E87_10110 [Burkholderiaceae bacterium]
MNHTTAAIFAAVALMSGCASFGGDYRNDLSKEEIETLKPEMAQHTTCMFGKVVSYAGGSTDIRLMVETAAANCRGALKPFASKLEALNVAPKVRAHYLSTLEKASSDVLTDRLLKARSRSRLGAGGGTKTLTL